MHEIASFDDCPAVGGHFHVVEIERAVFFDVDVFHKGAAFEAGIIGFDLLAGIDGIGFDEQPARLETRKTAVAGKRAAVVLDQPGAFATLAGEDFAGGAGLAVCA